ncbi:hypothetical protein CsSME_00053185 [Camellia sinensis var. sinensis]
MNSISPLIFTQKFAKYSPRESNRRLASNHFFKECKMVVLSFPQCHCHGWSWSSWSPLCHGKARMGSWCFCTRNIMGCHFIHLMANG